MRRFAALWILAGVAIAACGGGKKPETVATPTPNADSLAAVQRAHDDSLAAAKAAAEAQARVEQERLAQQRTADSLAALGRTNDMLKQTIAEELHFDFNKSVIRRDDGPTLDRKIPVLLANPTARIQIAGNCDERGSKEYNFALGNRRASTAKQYLVAHGVAADRIETISYGEERPVDPGHTEAAWASNRNDQFTILTNTDLRQP
jgi:peptidoglycan-associated lipoprotein